MIQKQNVCFQENMMENLFTMGLQTLRYEDTGFRIFKNITKLE